MNMGFKDDISEAAKGAVKTVSRGASELAEKSRSAIEKAADKERLSAQYERLGRLVASSETLKGDLCLADEKIAVCLRRIDELREKLGE